jgi:hypothetical protein
MNRRNNLFEQRVGTERVGDDEHHQSRRVTQTARRVWVRARVVSADRACQNRSPMFTVRLLPHGHNANRQDAGTPRSPCRPVPLREAFCRDVPR